MSDPSLVRFRAVVEGALAHLESRRQEINDLNVFPVADGDTGDNMALTLRACREELERLSTVDRPIDEIGREEVVESVARAALLGARGNSGVILSQLIRGAAEELISRPGELVDPTLVGAAMAQGAQRAYNSVREPAEGTILTVMREMATRAASEIAHMPDPRLAQGTPDEIQNLAIADILERALESGEAAVKHGPELLPALKQAGVVDAGGYAATVIFAGVVAALRGTAPPELEHHAPAVRVTHPEHESSTYRYCTNFAVTGRDLDTQAVTAAMEAMGDSVLVVGDHTTLKIHVHTNDPEGAMAAVGRSGTVSHTDVADMHAQVAERDARMSHVEPAPDRPVGRTAVVAVISGPGMRGLYESLGVGVLDGGLTLNPSTYELLAAIHASPAEEVVVLPNNPNVIMAAERAAELSDKVVHVVQSRAQQAGLAATVALNPDLGAADNAAAMDEVLSLTRLGGVAQAARDDGDGRFRTGDAVGFVDERIVAWGAPADTLRAVLAAVGEEAELITCIEGDGAPLTEDDIADLMPADVELEFSTGGQPAWWWLVAAE
jgi:DAK2 domain fusion protein YloV